MSLSPFEETYSKKLFFWKFTNFRPILVYFKPNNGLKDGFFALNDYKNLKSVAKSFSNTIIFSRKLPSPYLSVGVLFVGLIHIVLIHWFSLFNLKKIKDFFAIFAIFNKCFDSKKKFKIQFWVKKWDQFPFMFFGSEGSTRQSIFGLSSDRSFLFSFSHPRLSILFAVEI